MNLQSNLYTLQIFNTEIIIKTSLPKIINRIVDLYPTTTSWWKIRSTSRGTIQIDHLQADGLFGEQYSIFAELECFSHLSRCASLTVLLDRIYWYINNLPLYALPENYYTIHAAAVASARGAILLPGSSGTGKSTLTAALVSAGYTYLSDEIAIISDVERSVLPYPKPISLRHKGAEVLKQEFCDWVAKLNTGDLQYSWEGVLLSPRNYLPASFQGGFVVSYIIFPFREEQGIGSYLVPMRRSEALVRLMSQLISLRRNDSTSRNIEKMVQLIRQSKCYALRVGTLRSAVACIDRLLGDTAEDRLSPAERLPAQAVSAQEPVRAR